MTRTAPYGILAVCFLLPVPAPAGDERANVGIDDASRVARDPRGVTRAVEPALFASEARMAKRGTLRVNGGHDGNHERPATRHG